MLSRFGAQWLKVLGRLKAGWVVMRAAAIQLGLARVGLERHDYVVADRKEHPFFGDHLEGHVSGVSGKPARAVERHWRGRRGGCIRSGFPGICGGANEAEYGEFAVYRDGPRDHAGVQGAELQQLLRVW